MKLRVTLKATMVAAAVMAFAFLFSACESFWFYPEVELGLTSVKIGDLEITAIPAPIPGDDWDDEEYEVAASDVGLVIVKKETDMEDAMIKVEVNVPTAIVTWGLAKDGHRPDRFNDLRQPATFDWLDYFFFKVFDPDKDETKYYKFVPRDASPVRELVALTIAGRGATRVPQNATTEQELYDNIHRNAYQGRVDITRTEARLGSVVAGTPQDSTARLRYAKAEDLTEAQAGHFSEFVDTTRVVVQDEQGKDIHQDHGVLTFNDGNYIMVEVKAQNDDVNYYGFLVTAGHMAVIAQLTFGGVEAMGKGLQGPTWTSVTAGSFTSADIKPGIPVGLGINLEDREGSYEWAWIASASAGQPGSFNTTQNPAVPFQDKEALAIKVYSPERNDADTRYYKVTVNLLATGFRRHPQSAVYAVTDFSNLVMANAPGQDYNGRLLVDDPANNGKTVTLDKEIASLSFELDRTGNFSYQWYTANSWFGGYGFDKDGRIARDPGTVTDTYHPNPAQYDEKGNISFHNGGNQYYRLSNPGNPIPGETGPTYTPKIGAQNRPFITGFSNQTQYYWVEVTDNSNPAKPLKAYSDRAAIVTEWGYEFEKGIPKTEKVEKKHHIVDLHAYMGSSPYGLMGNPRNAIPFKAGNHADRIDIPLTFPPGFNVKEYSVVTCQAKFYLADGKEWIQNWTQGDFGFSNAGQETLVLWYNLTNDNATRGLDGTGNEPQGGGLDELPAHLIVQPAGTKPINELPPFTTTIDSLGRPQPQNNNNAQGWFTPYIEIVELRFEGPTRVKD
jgi:hypothetical protein